jgi:hypothetical protein
VNSFPGINYSNNFMLAKDWQEICRALSRHVNKAPAITYSLMLGYPKQIAGVL